jgi:hypothetical protein
MFPIFAGNSAATGYNFARSVRLRQSATAYLSRTFTSTGNRQIWTWSGWVKRGALSSGTLFGADGSNYAFLYFSPDSLDCGEVVVTQQWRRITTQVFRDPSAWYHVVFAFDSTQATAGNRIKLYVNGTQVTAFSTTADPSLNYNSIVNTTIAHSIGSFAAPTRQAYLDGYLTEINFIDGQALTPTSFGSFDSLTGVWKPARYSGSYGTNGFYLPFTDNSALTTSSNVGLGKDFSGNGNYWTTNNISITAGVTYDSMTDVPTLTSATAANFCVWNPIFNAPNQTVTNGNLAFSNSGSTATIVSTMGMDTGKYYAEFVFTTGLTYMNVGIANANLSKTNYVGSDTNGFGFLSGNGSLYYNGTAYSYGSAFPANATIMIAFDATNGKIWWGVNGTWVNSGNPATGANPGVAASGATINVTLATTTYFFASGTSVTNGCSANFGQQPFTYTPPTGFVALNTYNLPTSTIVKGNTVMDATLYTGTLLSNAITNAAAFKPDLVWLKSRSAATDNKLTDSIRGVTKGLISNTTGAETTDTQGLTAFNTNGFTVGTNTDYNNLAATYVAWQWQAGQGSSSSNTNGSITSTVSVNASAGFSIATFTANGTAGATIGHGLGVAPAFYIVKCRSNSPTDWVVYHSSLGATQGIYLSLTNSAATSSAFWNNTAPTSSVFSIGSSSNYNVNGYTNVAYCWTPIAGFSAFGSLTGNGSADGVFVYLGFKPRFILYKRTDSTSDWRIWDTARTPYNAMSSILYPDVSDAEYTASTQDFDALSNGFKIRNSSAAMNASGGTYIYAAFASNPFRNSLAQ